MTTRRKIWAGLTILVIALFTFIIPIHVIDSYPMMFLFLAAGLLVITLGQTIADFDSIYELFEKQEEGAEIPANKKYFGLAIIPGIIFLIFLIFHNGDRKDKELKEFGVLVKGTVTNGSATTTTRRFQKNTSYDLYFNYKDSTGRVHQFEQSVSGSEFDDAYQGQEADIIYSSKHPGLAKAILGLDELAKYRKVADGAIGVQQLISILESTKPDTIVNYLNTISYIWKQSNEGVYANEKRDIAIKVFPGNEELAYMDNSGGAFNRSNDNFEKSLETFGFKKKAVTENNETREMYYTDKYGVSKENKMLDSEDRIGFTSVVVYHVFLLEALGE